MKTLKQFQEATGYLKVKSPDEQKFVDKHEVERMDDQNGNGDDVFKASNVKKVARKAERKGYEPGEDESVYEEAEQIDESWTPVNTGMAKKHFTRAALDYKKKAEDHLSSAKGRAVKDSPQYRSDMAKHHEAMANHIKNSAVSGSARHSNISDAKQEYNQHKAKAKQYKSGINEEAEQIDELSRATVGRYSMKAKSIADNEGGKDRSKGRELAGRKRWGGTMSGVPKARVMASEEIEELDELSTATLQSYRKKARAQGNAIVDKMKMGGGDWSKDQRDTKTLRKRAAGAQASGKQLVKRGESLKTEEVEQIEESAGGRYNDVHNSTKDLLKKINTHLTTHKANAMKSKNYKGEKGPHWGHVEHMKDIHRTLSDIHDRLAQQGEYAMHEEVEQVDEISKATMGRYINRAKDQIDTVSYRQGHRDSRGAGGDPISRKNERKLSKRHGGIELAVKKMTKEEADYLINRYADFKENISGLAPRLQEALHDVLDRLNEENQDVFMTSCQTEEGLEKMVAFAIENRGE